MRNHFFSHNYTYLPFLAILGDAPVFAAPLRLKKSSFGPGLDYDDVVVDCLSEQLH